MSAAPASYNGFSTLRTTQAPKRTIHTTQYKTSGKLNSTSGGPRSAVALAAKIHSCTYLSTHDRPSAHGPCAAFTFPFFSPFFLAVCNERAEERSNLAFTSIRDSTGLFSQAVSSAQLASSHTHTGTQLTSPGSREFLTQYYTSLAEPGPYHYELRLHF